MPFYHPGDSKPAVYRAIYDSLLPCGVKNISFLIEDYDGVWRVAAANEFGLPTEMHHPTI